MGASLAFAGVTAGCARQPSESIFPYVKPPEELIPGVPSYFATSHVSDGYATGVLVESHMGRPTKMEGNPGHPSSLGTTAAQTQARTADLAKQQGEFGLAQSQTGLQTANLNAGFMFNQRGSSRRLVGGARRSAGAVGSVVQFRCVDFSCWANARRH